MAGPRGIPRVVGKPFRLMFLAAIMMVVLPGVLYGQASARTVSNVTTGGTVVIDNVGGSLWTCVFNPYSATGTGFAGGIIYEPLYYVNQLNGKTKPWLATSYFWGNGNKSLTFIMRKGVKWSDGKSLTPYDVAFTFNLMHRFSALDLNAAWSVLKSVKVVGNDVKFTFKHPAVPFFYYIADQSYILPQHIWASIKNPVTFQDKNPVGSGPFKVSSCSPQNITYVRNPSYWQPGKPYVDKVEYPAFLDNQPGNAYLAQGKANWGGQYIPNVKAYYVNRDPAHRHIWYPPSGDIGLYTNLDVAPLNDIKVRQALACAIDRGKVSRIGVYGYLPPANQSGVVVPTQKSWFDPGMTQKLGCGYNPAKARKILESDGYKMGSNGIFAKNGKPLSLTVLNVGGFTDWVAEVNVIQSSVKASGIDLKPLNLSGNDVTAREQAGHFQLAYGGPAAGPTPYYWFKNLLYSKNSAPIGGTASTNFDRYMNPRTDALFTQFESTTNAKRQHAIVNQLERVMLTNLPFIPVLEGVHWYQYDTTQLTGWPTRQNPYASPAPYDIPDWEMVLLNLHLK